MIVENDRQTNPERLLCICYLFSTLELIIILPFTLS
jgi:hypothetical protein